MGRHANPDIRRAFAEFQDQDTPSKCNKVRCLHCGFVRAKNTTRQIEHLQECQPYLQSADVSTQLGQTPNGSVMDPTIPDTTTQAMLNGTHPNPNLQVHRRGPNQNKRGRDGGLLGPPQSSNSISSASGTGGIGGIGSSGAASTGGASAPAVQAISSLTSHLLNRNQNSFQAATQQPFLSHAGCGTLTAGPLTQWMVQDSILARGYIRFIGGLLAKVRLPAVQNSQFHPLYRTVDLLLSALNNVRREMQFFEITATKYGLQLSDDAPTHITKAHLDLYMSASSSGASLLEGMVIVWATEHCYRTAWHYAASFSHSLSSQSTDSHIVALHQALIPNWTSHPFIKFVDACRALVDELASDGSTSPVLSGRDGNSSNIATIDDEEMTRCEEVFQQVCWLRERFWPDVDGMGEDADDDDVGMNSGGQQHHSRNQFQNQQQQQHTGNPNGNNIVHNHNNTNAVGATSNLANPHQQHQHHPHQQTFAQTLSHQQKGHNLNAASTRHHPHHQHNNNTLTSNHPVSSSSAAAALAAAAAQHHQQQQQQQQQQHNHHSHAQHNHQHNQHATHPHLHSHGHATAGLSVGLGVGGGSVSNAAAAAAAAGLTPQQIAAGIGSATGTPEYA